MVFFYKETATAESYSLSLLGALRTCPTRLRIRVVGGASVRGGHRGGGRHGVGGGPLLSLLVVVAHQGLPDDGLQADGVTGRLGGRVAADTHWTWGEGGRRWRRGGQIERGGRRRGG